LALLITVNTLQCVLHDVAKGRVTDQFLDALKRVSSPELNFLNDWIPSVVQLVAMDFDEVAFPFRPQSRKVVDFLKQRIFCSERWLRFVTDLWCAMNIQYA
jgi:hypothetical protein